MSNAKDGKISNLDYILLFSFISLLLIGFVMVASASTPIAERMKLPIFYFAINQGIYILVGLSCAYIVTLIPIDYIKRTSPLLLISSTLLLIMVLIPGVTKPINGSLRWIFFGPISVQPSEIAKIALIAYIASYMVRRNQELRSSIKGFLIPMFVLSLIALLLLCEPDFGAVVVIATTIFGMLFLGGVRLNRFLILLPPFLVVLGFILFSSSYRVKRMVSFTNPWEDQYNTGYQLVQSLIAFGRGEWFGTGLGGSVQKLLYLPESHSDFIFAVIAEELGLIGALAVLLLYVLFIFRAMEIGRRAQKAEMFFASFLSYGIAMTIALQVMINIGVNMGVLPTKGLTLPFLSAGGSSLVMVCIATGILFRVDFERRNRPTNTRKSAT